ncbi:hypothetical protein ACIBVL_37270 [Streptomyces sp. NPDC049687]|uniref:hypothetical protein n=1 Tax=Streptomyces sp. NPDC049687 TaxID=3365596 RepID=UPI0037BC16C2
MTIPHDRRSPAEERDDYSATVLDSHWVVRPDDGTTVLDTSGPTASPEHTDGTVLRFGPGVTAARSYGVHPTAVLPTPPARPHRRLRRHTLPALVLLAAVLFLLWRQHDGPGPTVREVTAAAALRSTGCDGTADVVGVVRTDGRRGELSYRWVRNDGTASDVLHATVAEGRRVVRLHLLWTFQGHGRYTAVAELRVLSAGGGAAKAEFTYACP